MAHLRSADAERSVADLARLAIDELTNLIGAQGRLLRLELKADVQHVARRALVLAALAPLLLVGYAFVLFAAAEALRPALGGVGAFAVIGGVNLVAGGIGIWRLLAAPTAVFSLERSRDEIKTTVEAVAAAATSKPVDGANSNRGAALEGKAHA